jgi:hypothetical protein
MMGDALGSEVLYDVSTYCIKILSVGFNAATGISACAQADDYINTVRILRRMQQEQQRLQ